MRRLAFGALHMDAERFEKMLVGDFLDAMGGYNEAELERLKPIAELIRTSTALLWNLQVDRNSKRNARELWPFPWDEGGAAAQGHSGARAISVEEREKIEVLHEEILKGMMK